jgi:hypothetical protein
MRNVIPMAYVDGIREGRETLNQLVADGVQVDAAEIAARCRDFIDRLSVCAYSEPHMDFLKGELHFWENQAKKSA